MKIVHLMGALRPSGMERMFLSAANCFKDAGVETVIVGQGGEHPFAQQLHQAGYGVRCVPSLRTIAGAIAWLRLLRELRPDVIHIHTEGAFIVSALGARAALPKTPIVRTVHSIFRPTGRAKLSRRIQGFAADKVVSKFIAVSPDVRNNERAYNREAQLIFNWVDDKFFTIRESRGPHGGRAAAVIVGNSSPIKNHALALRAVQETGVDLYFHGDESGATQEEVDILDVLQKEGRLRHRGISDPRPSLAVGSTFLLPSTHEGMPIALSEALVAGLPAIVNDVPGVGWAADFPNVTVLPMDQNAWTAAVENAKAAPFVAPAPVTELPIDLSTQRGVGEYIELYTEVLA